MKFVKRISLFFIYPLTMFAAGFASNIAIMEFFYPGEQILRISEEENSELLPETEEESEDTEPVAFLSEKAVQCLLSQPGTATKIGLRDSCFMVLMYDTAARDCEMLSLRINSLDLNRKCPTARLEGKGNKVRYVPLMKKTAEYVRKYLEIFHPAPTRHADDWLFYTVSHGRRHKMSDDNVARFLAKYSKMAHAKCREVFEKVTPHQFRHYGE